jgi:hypothetical protein
MRTRRRSFAMASSSSLSNVNARAPAVPRRAVAAIACGMENFEASTVAGSTVVRAWPPGPVSTRISAISSTLRAAQAAEQLERRLDRGMR